MEAFWIAMTVVALAELGDKTQLVAIVMANRFRRPIAVAAGMVVALSIMHALAALGGAWISRIVPEQALAWLVAAGFLAMAMWMGRSSGRDRSDIPRPQSRRHAFATALFVFMALEFGDKSQLTTIGLSMALDPAWLVGLGAAAGSILINLPMIWLGYRLQERLPHRLLHRLATAVFALAGLVLLIQAFRLST